MNLVPSFFYHITLMVKRNTGYTTSTGAPIFSENGEFYYREYNSQPWRIVPGGWKYYKETWTPSGKIVYATPDRVSRLKTRFNKAARKIQNAYRRYRSVGRKSSPKRSPYTPRSMRKIPNTRVGNNK